MPSNIKLLKKEIKRETTSRAPGTALQKISQDIQQITAATLLGNLAKYTDVDTGTLAGGWKLLLRKGKGSGGTIPKPNKTRYISPDNSDRVDRIDGRFDVQVINRVPYADEVNYGSGGKAPSNFVQKAILSTKVEVQALLGGD